MSLKEQLQNINWKVRFQNPEFWRGIIAAVGMLLVAVFALLGVNASADIEAWQSAMYMIVTAVFSIFNLIGVAVDPTTEGMGDSQQAMTYEQPKGKTVSEEVGQ